MFTIADVAFKISGAKSIFTYIVPNDLADIIQIGQLVEVNIRNRPVLGIVYRLSKAEDTSKLKPINKIIHPDLCVTSTQIELAEWLSQTTLSSIGICLFSFIPIIQTPPKLDADEDEIISSAPIKLNSEQKRALQIIEQSVKPTLLYGITGSGKTEVYMECAKEILDKGKSVLILIPEISLTPQTVARFEKRFGNIVGAWHSRLTTKQRRTVWWMTKKDKIRLVVGSRSALFLPFNNLGLIVIDEEHDNSYYQESAPRYHAIELARYYAKISSAKLILGSATPSAETVWKVSQKLIEMAKLDTRYNQTNLPETTIVDLTNEKLRPNSIISYTLQLSIANVIANKRQVVLLLNRRGFAPATLCTNCGYISKCPNCDIALTAHYTRTQSNPNLMCHHCDFIEPLPAVCPNCDHPTISTKGYGTESVERELKILFPTARIIRADKDTTTGRMAIDKIYHSFANGDFDILLGTQMIAKGWDIPTVDLVGILLAESGLMIPDYRSATNTFNLLVQASGRSGRGSEIGQTIIQTYQPDNPLIRQIANHDFGSYIKEELRNRKKYGYPPFKHLFRLVYSHVNINHCIKECDKMLGIINNLDLVNSEILGPSPCFFEKIRGKFRYHIIIKTDNENDMDILRSSFANLSLPWIIEINPNNLL